jgi:hypothetical protein
MTPFSFLKSISALVKAFIARVIADGGIVEAARCIVKNTASLAMQPSGYKATKLYSQKPSSGVGDFTVDRNSTATRVNSLGLIESVAANVPRLDYTDGNCPSLLLEPQSTNLFSYSQDYNNAYWAKANGLTVSTLGGGISPDGVNNADLITVNSGRLNKDLSVINGATYTVSVYYKGTFGETLNLLNNVITLTGDWQRQSVTFTTSSTFIGIALIDNRFSGTAAFVEVWGAQLEQSSVATSYIPTSGTTVTRLADSVTGAGDVNTFNNSEGVLYAEIAALSNDATNKAIAISDGTNSNRLLIFYSSSVNQITSLIVLAGVVQGRLNSTITDSTDFNKIAFKYKENDFALWVNGVKVATDLSGSTFSTSTLNKLSYNSGSSSDVFFGKTKDLRVYNTALTDAELTELTTL